MALIGEMQYLTIGGNTYSLPSGGGGSVTSVAVSNATNGGLSVSGSPISSSGTITIGHSNVLSAAQTTQAVYPIKIDKNGHISAYGTAINLSEYAQLAGASFTGPVTFGDSVTADELETGDLVVTGAASFTNNINANTINGVAVGNSPKFTDTVTTVTTTGSGNAITAVSATNGAITATKGTTFLTSHQDISGKADKSATVSNVAYDSTNAKITKTINGTTSDVVTVATLKSALGSMPASDVYSWAKASTKPTYTASEVGALASNTTYVSTITTTAGTHSAISSKSGAVSFNVPTKTSHLTNDSGYITASHTSTYSLPLAASGTRGGVQIGYSESGTNYAVKLSSEKMYVTVPWTDTKVTNTAATAATTYYLTGSTSSTTATDGLSKHASLAAYTTADTATSGYTQLRLGNTTVTSSAGGKEGQIRLYGTTATYYVDLKAGAPSANRTITFPNKTGTVALTSDIPNVFGKITVISGAATAYDAPSANSTLELTAGTNTTLSATDGTDYIGVTINSTDQKLQVAALTSGTTYYPILATGTGTATRQIDSTLGGLKYVSTAGTTSAVGTATLYLGNTTGSGTANNEQGVLRLYSSNATYYTDLKSSSASSNKTITFPNATGTVALTSDIPTVSYPVTSVNSKTGAVSLTASDVGALPSSTTIPTHYHFGVDSGSTSQQNYQGFSNLLTFKAGNNMSLTLQEDNNLSRTIIFNASVPTKVSELTNDSGYITNAGVTSITTTAGAHSTKSSATGAVSFNVPTKTSHLTNDSGFITNAGVTSITTAAGKHSTESSATGAVSFNVPTTLAHLDTARVVVEGTDSMSAVSCSAGGWVTIGSITLAAGTWIVNCRARFTPTASGTNYSAVCLGTSTAQGWYDRRYSESTYQIQHSFVQIVHPTESTTYYLRGNCNNAGKFERSNGAAYSIDAIRIAMDS